MAEINQHSVNSTNLSETYMYKKNATDRNNINFYKYYKNNENDIDDPIFTGFTFDIDTLHSPLFFGGDEYDTQDTLRGGSSTNLASKIEARLLSVYKSSILGATNSYEINNITVKDIIKNSIRAGYGLQDQMAIDGIPYGAIDYIYMVDKVATGLYSNELGTSDIGSGTQNTSAYDNIIRTDVTSTLNENGEVVNTITNVKMDNESITNKLKELEDAKNAMVSDEINMSNIDYHNELKRQMEEALAEYNAKKEDIVGGTGGLDYAKLKDEYKLDEKAMQSEWDDIQNKLNEYKKEAKIYFDKIEESKEAEGFGEEYDKMTDLYNDFDAFIKLIQNDDNSKYPHVKGVKVTLPEHNTEGEQKLTADEKNSKIIQYIRFYFTIDGTQIQKKDFLELLQDKSGKIREVEATLYGVDKSGRPLCENNADPDSLYGKYMELKRQYENDNLSNIEQQIAELNNMKDMLGDAAEFEKYRDTKNNELPTPKSIDNPTLQRLPDETDDQYFSRVETSVNDSLLNGIDDESRGFYDAPQTVYDLLGFISGMKKLTHEYPYMLQSITGLDEAYKKYFSPKDPYQGSGDDKVTITCYEALDLRVSSMFNKYFHASFDHQYKRERLPINLRRFQCSVFVHDIRNFRGSLSNYFPESDGGDSPESKLVEIALNYVSAIEFKFFDCEIIPEETGSLFDSVSNAEGGTMKQTNFTFKYGNCVINFLPFEDLRKYYGGVKRSSGTQYEKEFENIESSDESKKFEQAIRNLNNNFNTSVNTLKNYNVNESETTKNELQNIHNIYNQEISNSDSGDYRRWFDRSELGNIENNDYKEYIRRDSHVAVDDYYKSTMVDSFAMNSIVNKSKERTAIDDALRRIITGIAASTGNTVKTTTDALNIGFIYPIINNGDGSDMPVVTHIGNVTNSKIITPKINEYLGVVHNTQESATLNSNLGKINGVETEELDIITDLGKIK